MLNSPGVRDYASEVFTNYWHLLNDEEKKWIKQFIYSHYTGAKDPNASEEQNSENYNRHYTATNDLMARGNKVTRPAEAGDDWYSAVTEIPPARLDEIKKQGCKRPESSKRRLLGPEDYVGSRTQTVSKILELVGDYDEDVRWLNRNLALIGEYTVPAPYLQCHLLARKWNMKLWELLLDLVLTHNLSGREVAAYKFRFPLEEAFDWLPGTGVRVNCKIGVDRQNSGFALSRSETCQPREMKVFPSRLLNQTYPRSRLPPDADKQRRSMFVTEKQGKQLLADLLAFTASL